MCGASVLGGTEMMSLLMVMSCKGSAATATWPVHAGENLGVIKYERWKRRQGQGSIVAPMATTKH